MAVGLVDHTSLICMNRHTAGCNYTHTAAAAVAAAVAVAADCYSGRLSVEHRRTLVDWLRSGVTSDSCSFDRIEDTAGCMHQDSRKDSQPDLGHPSVGSAEPDELACLEQEYSDHYAGLPVDHSLLGDELMRTDLACLEQSCRTHCLHVERLDSARIDCSRLGRQQQHHGHSTAHTAAEQRQVQCDQESDLRMALAL